LKFAFPALQHHAFRRNMMRPANRSFLSACGAWLLLVAVIVAPRFANADTRSEILAAYSAFAAAQNARDPARISAALLDSPDFLWISDGKSLWGRDATLERMSRFQTLEVWRVEPLLDRARVVEVAADVAYVHMPLDLRLGTKGALTVTRFLVSILCRKTADGWRIAALFTTLDNPG
jgi:ketosteroid isomerase-like protein